MHPTAMTLVFAALVLSAASVAAGFAFRNSTRRKVFVGLCVMTVAMYPMVYYYAVVRSEGEEANGFIWLGFVVLLFSAIALFQILLSGLGAGVYWWHRLDGTRRVGRIMRTMLAGIVASMALGIFTYLCIFIAGRFFAAFLETVS